MTIPEELLAKRRPEMTTEDLVAYLRKSIACSKADRWDYVAPTLPLGAIWDACQTIDRQAKRIAELEADVTAIRMERDELNARLLDWEANKYGPEAAMFGKGFVLGTQSSARRIAEQEYRIKRLEEDRKAALYHVAEQCDDAECMICGERDCPYDEPLHYHHDGCPSCVRAAEAAEPPGGSEG